MVGANTFRNPGLTAKLATTLDHISGGRAILGIGGAWFEREHDAFGIEPGARASASGSTGSTSRSALLRRLLDGERITHDGPLLHDARRALRAAPGPGPPADPDRRLRAAEDAPDDRPLRRRLEHRRARVEELASEGRDPPRALRRDRPEPRRDRADDVRLDAASATTRPRRGGCSAGSRRRNGDTLGDGRPRLRRARREQIADELRPVVELGFRHVIAT